MAMTPEPLMPVTNAISIRAPPSSPVAPGRQSSFSNDDVLTEYLEQSLKVPDLIILPGDRVFPKQKSIQNPPKIDLQNLELPNESGKEVSELIAQVGCLEVINHGVSRDLIKLVLFLAAGIFEILPEEKKTTVVRSLERRYGFEETHGEGEIRDECEEFLWCGDEAMRLEMEGVWPFGYSNFSQEIEKLYRQIEEVGRKILHFLEQHSMRNLRPQNSSPEDEELTGNLCYIKKHHRKTEGDRSGNSSLRYDDVIRMLIRGSEFPHALCLHICNGSSDFHVYSKKGWVSSFCPNQDSIVITVGDKLKSWSSGQYKHVIGRPVLKGEDEKYISMAFLFSPSNLKKSIKDDDQAQSP